MISLPTIAKVIERKGNKAILQIEAFYPGYGVTVGNSLRRALLSSLSGAAVTKMKIKGVQHEFSTLPGVIEDIITIMLNLKQLRFKIFSDEPQAAVLKIKGEKEVKASHFQFPSQVELISKNVHIATLTSKSAELEMEIQIEKGIGYVPRELRQKEKLAIGEIPLDAIFTPIKRVSYRIENTRLGERTDFDRLFLEIETDGTMTPEEAFSSASDVLEKHFSFFRNQFEKIEKPATDKITGEDFLKIKVEDLKFSKRTLNALIQNNLKTLGGITKKSKKDLLGLEGMGEKGIQEIKRKMKKFNLELKE